MPLAANVLPSSDSVLCDLGRYCQRSSSLLPLGLRASLFCFGSRFGGLFRNFPLQGFLQLFFVTSALIMNSLKFLRELCNLPLLLAAIFISSIASNIPIIEYNVESKRSGRLAVEAYNVVSLAPGVQGTKIDPDFLICRCRAISGVLASSKVN